MRRIIILFVTTLTATLLTAQDFDKNSKAYKETEKKVEKINKELKRKGLRWRSGVTSISLLSEKEFRNLCGETFDPTKVEYELQKQDSLYQLYKNEKKKTLGRIMSIPNWKSLMSKIENQKSCGNCWAHATSGVVEGVLHNFEGYNFGLNLDEMDILSWFSVNLNNRSF